MVSVQDQFLKALMERFPHPGRGAVVEALPQELAERIQCLPDKVGKAPESFFAQAKNVLQGMHPTWCEELVLLTPEPLQPLMRALILDVVGRGKKGEAAGLTVPVRDFLLRYVVDKWPERSIQGVEEIEGTSFRWLATSEERTIVLLAGLLAIHDVVDVVRQIVDKRILQKIFTAMTSLQQRYLRSLLHRPARSATLNKELTALLLDDPKAGAQMLMRRGLEKLAVAMQDEPPLLQWYVLHHIDQERAQFLVHAMEKKNSAAEKAEMKRHLTHAHQFLKKMETT